MPGDAAPVRKSTKEMTKAERRELQESQRAAKAAAKTTPGGGGGPAGAAPQRQQAQQNPSPKPTSESTVSKAPPQRPALAPVQRVPLDFFEHLKPSPPPTTSGIAPSIITLGAQYASYRIKGSNARAIHLVTSLKEAILTYEPTKGQPFTLRMLAEYLDRQVNFLGKSRVGGLAQSMRSVVGEMKGTVARLGVEAAEEEAKKALISSLDDFMETRIRKATALLADKVASKIAQERSTLAVFGKSSAVLDGLLKAHTQGKRFSVVVIDAKPLLEGRESATLLSSHHIPTTYLLLTSSLPHLKLSSHLFLGASSVASNGSVVARCGAGYLACLAKSVGVPVTVFAESYKDAEGPRFNSLSWNELATFPDSQPSELITYPPLSDPASKLDNKTLSPLYDVIPGKLITEVVRE